MIKKKTRMLVLSIVVFSNFISAQTITNYTDADGLLDNFVECVTVDENNNIWFGTISGVSMFDGTNWTSYSQSDYPSMANDNIKVITAASNGDIWIGTDFGASIFDGSGWTTYTSANGLNNNQVKSIDEGLNGDIWIGTNTGVSVFNGANWSSYGSPDLHWSGVISTSFDSQGDKWFASPLGGITHYDGNTFTNYDTSSGLLSMYTTSILVDELDRKWTGTGSGMTVLDNTNSTFTNHTIMYVLPPPDTINPVVDIAEDSWGKIWTTIYVGYLAQGGVAYYDGASWIDFDESDGITGPNVRGLAIDLQDNIWVATSTGVSMISAISSSIEDIESNKFNLFPNPTTGNFTIDFFGVQPKSIKVFNSIGEQVFFEDKIYNRKTFDCTNLKKGFYYVQCNIDQDIITKKISIL